MKCLPNSLISLNIGSLDQNGEALWAGEGGSCWEETLGVADLDLE